MNGEPDQETSITGTVAIGGAPLADLADPKEVGDQDAEKWAVRLIDPVEDVDAIELPNDDAAIPLTAVAATGELLLEISLLPAVDLDGGDAAVTPVQLNVPVVLAVDQLTTVTVSIDFVTDAAAVSWRVASQGTAYHIRLAWQVGGPSPGQGSLDIDWSGRRLRRDTNGDGRFDDETAFADADRNGISDNLAQRLHGGSTGGQTVTAAGPVQDMDLGQATLTVGGREFVVDETTTITRAGAPVSLAGIQLGEYAEVYGVRGRYGLNYADTIAVDD